MSNFSKIFIETKEVFTSLNSAYHHLRVRTQKAPDPATVDWDAEGYANFTETPYNPATEKQDGVECVEGQWRRKIVTKDVDELALQKADYKRQVFDACERYVDMKGAPDDPLIVPVKKHIIGEISVKADKQKPKSTAIRDWVLACYRLAYEREAMLDAGVEFTQAMLDFSSKGPLPETIESALPE